jgi:GAF domain-containing protein
MSETLAITPGLNRTETYRELLPQLLAMIEAERDTIATLANLSAALRQAFGFHWVGFYLVRGDELVLGPFQGPIACTRIAKGKGVCGTAWATNTTQLVPDVEAFPGHIACSSLTKSEIVVPVHDEAGDVWAVLDIDSSKGDDFSAVDQEALEQLAAWLVGKGEVGKEKLRG